MQLFLNLFLQTLYMFQAVPLRPLSGPHNCTYSFGVLSTNTAASCYGSS